MNLKDYQTGRNDGLALAAKIIKEGGVEALEAEIRQRGVCGVNTNLTMKELDEALFPIKSNCIDTVMALFLAVLRDEFGFGKARLERARDRFSLKANCLGEYVKWADIVKTIEEETGVKVEIRNMDELDTVWTSQDVR